MGLSTVQYFRDLYPESTIIYGVPQWTKSIFDEVKVACDFIYPMNLGSVNGTLQLWSDLLNFEVDLIHEMHQSGKGAKAFGSYSMLKRIPYSFHNHHLKSGTKIHDQGVIKSIIQRDLDGVYSFYGQEKAYPHFEDYTPQMSVADVVSKNQIILGVVATRETKMWPLLHYKKLAELFFEFDSSLQIKIPLSNSKQDSIIKEEIIKLNFPKNTEIVHLPLKELPKFFAGSIAYIGNDTGIKHLAVAVGVSTFTFFGAEPPNEWHPYNIVQHPYFYRDHLPCRTRTHHYCGLSQCDLKSEEFMQCLTKILPETVFHDVTLKLKPIFLRK